MAERILAINPGSTSTKIALYAGTEELFCKTIDYPAERIHACPSVYSQLDFRLADVLRVLSEHGIDPESPDFIIGRGGAVKPVHGGAWEITEKMLDDLRKAVYADHASNLGAMIVHELASKKGIPACVVDPPATDEMDDVARVTGHPLFRRRSRLHTLNQKAVAHRAAAELGIPYKKARLIVAHLGGGVSVGAHRRGRIVDVNDAYDGSGPMSPERSGTLPAGQVAKLCFSGDYTPEEFQKMLVGRGGLFAHLGTTDVREILRRIDSGDDHARLVLDAMIYQTAREIGACAAVLEGVVDGVVLTGSIMQSDILAAMLSRKIAFLGRVLVYPGEDEMEALRDAALRVIRGGERVNPYR